MTNCQSTLNNVMADSQEMYNMFYGSDDEDEEMFEDLFDDDELEHLTAPHYRTTDAYYYHQDRLDSHIFKTYLSSEAAEKGVQDRSTYLGKKFRHDIQLLFIMSISELLYCSVQVPGRINNGICFNG